jgi:predicted MPP superfamily phosphohydrolase
MRRALQRLLLALVLAGAAVIAFAYWTAVSDPVVRRVRIAVPAWPAGAPPMRLVLLSDIHVGGPDMPPARVRRIVGQVNRLAPDIVLIAGDFVTDKRLATRHYSHDEAVAPLAALRPRLATLAVLGNHDHWRDSAAAHRALARAGIKVLDNGALQIGPVAVGGLDDAFTGRDDLPATLAALGRLDGPKLILSHSPDPFADLKGPPLLMLAGHTHCGQVALPLIGPLSTMSKYGRRYACGIVRERGRTLIVTAGLGTSGLPLRLGAAPDLWLIELGPRCSPAFAGKRPDP